MKRGDRSEARAAAWRHAARRRDLHARSCAIYTSGHEQAKNGQPGAFRPVPCDCGKGETQ